MSLSLKLSERVKCLTYEVNSALFTNCYPVLRMVLIVLVLYSQTQRILVQLLANKFCIMGLEQVHRHRIFRNLFIACFRPCLKVVSLFIWNRDTTYMLTSCSMDLTFSRLSIECPLLKPKLFGCRSLIRLSKYCQSYCVLFDSYKIRYSFRNKTLSSSYEDKQCIVFHQLLVLFSQDGRTALIYASKKGNFDTVEKLLAAGAQPDHQDKVSYYVGAKIAKLIMQFLSSVKASSKELHIANFWTHEHWLIS